MNQTKVLANFAAATKAVASFAVETGVDTTFLVDFLLVFFEVELLIKDFLVTAMFVSPRIWIELRYADYLASGVPNRSPERLIRIGILESAAYNQIDAEPKFCPTVMIR